MCSALVSLETRCSTSTLLFQYHFSRVNSDICLSAY